MKNKTKKYKIKNFGKIFTLKHAVWILQAFVFVAFLGSVYTSNILRLPETNEAHSEGPVRATVFTGLPNNKDWNAFVGSSNFPNSPTYATYQDDMMSGSSQLYDNYGLRLEAYFIPPATGDYWFKISCDDICMFNMGETEHTKSTIIDYRSLYHTTAYYHFDVYSHQVSPNSHYLVQNQKYYVELLMRDHLEDDHVELIFLNPETGNYCAMSRMYLQRI